MDNVRDLLSYDDEKNSFLWKGSQDDLKYLIDTVLNVDSGGEWSEDASHSAVSYKINGCYTRLYKSTNRLVIQGPNHAILRDKLTSLLAGPSAVNAIITAEESVNESPNTSFAETLRSPEPRTPVQEEINKLWAELYSIKTQMRSIDKEKSEIEVLKEEIVKLRNANSLLEAEKSSLLTSLRMLVNNGNNGNNDGKLHGTNTEMPQHPEVEKNAKKTKKPKKGQKRSSNPSETQIKATASDREKNNNTSAILNDRESSHQQKKVITIVGDSMIKGLEPWRMGNKDTRVSTKNFPGSTTLDMMDYIKPTLRRTPDVIILHTGTNYLAKESPQTTAEKIVTLGEFIEQECPNTKIAISSLINRGDKLSHLVQPTNKHLQPFCKQRGWDFIHHKIDASFLNKRGLHLTKAGSSALANDFMNHFKSIN